MSVLIASASHMAGILNGVFLTGLATAIAFSATPTLTRGQSAERPPNFVVLLCDNLGYGDVACYGSQKHRTPHIDQMAREGMRFTSFYATSGVCSPRSPASPAAPRPRIASSTDTTSSH